MKEVLSTSSRAVAGWVYKRVLAAVYVKINKIKQ